MISFPLRSRTVAGLGSIVANKAGRFFVSNETKDWNDEQNLSDGAQEFLEKYGHSAAAISNLTAVSHTFQTQARDTRLANLDYLILVPTLRCNLTCSYCQVSRADIGQFGYDWTAEILEQLLIQIDGLKADSIKIEFQGGEPTLRLDLVRAVIERCDRFIVKEFVICTNLSTLSDELLALLDRPDVSLSTSLDGDAFVHTSQRTQSQADTNQFLDNLGVVIARYGSGKVSALPTINPNQPPGIDNLIDAYTQYGFTSIYLRPINYHGFARKRHPSSRDEHGIWWQYYDTCIDRIIDRNFEDRSQVLDESYLSLCLRRIFRIGLDRHVDLRNPNPVGVDYIVVDYDGRIYPTDEARMV